MRVLQWIYCIYALILFVAIMLLLFPFVIIASFFGRITGGNIIFRLCMIWADLWFPLVFIFPKRKFVVPHNESVPYIFVSNHISYLDAAILPKAFRQPIRALGKYEMSRIPVFGYIYKYAVVMVDRSNTENRAKSVRTLESVIRKGISIVIFPEGTFNMSNEPLKAFYDGAFRVAIETQTPIKPVLFLDSFDRMGHTTIFSLTPGRCRILYLDEISVVGATIKDVPGLREKVYNVMSDALREQNVSWIKR